MSKSAVFVTITLAVLFLQFYIIQTGGGAGREAEGIAALGIPAAHAGAFEKTDSKESVYDRVMRTGKIRCGYAMWTPVLYKDLETGKLSGMFYDLMEEVGKRLDLEIVWTEESGWGTVVEGIVTNRYDMICAGLGYNSARAKFIDFGQPIFYTPMYVAVRAGDTRFDGNIREILNDPDYTIAVLDGELSSVVARQIFPEAQTSAMSQILDYSQLFIEVEMGKVDATLVEPGAFRQYEKHNPGKLRMLDGGPPVNVFPISVGLPPGDTVFNRMVDVVLIELTNDGTVERILNKYEEFPEAFLRPMIPYKPYALPEESS